MMDVLFLGPGYPGEMALFTRGLAEVGARVIGVGDQPVDALPQRPRRALEVRPDPVVGRRGGALRTVLGALRGRKVDLVETLWEPTVVLAARLRERIGAPGLSVEQAVTFRDKGRMKDVLVRAGIRMPDRCGRVRWPAVEAPPSASATR